MPQPVRLAGEDLGCPDIRRIGCRSWSRSAPQGKGAHAHADHWELHWLAAGRAPYRLNDRRFTLHAGDVVLVAPGTEHDGIDTVHHRCRLCWVSWHVPARGALPGLDRAAARQLREHLRAAADRWAPGSRAVADAMLLVNHLARQPAQPVILRAAVQALFLVATDGLRDHDPVMTRLAHDQTHANVQRLLERFRAQLESPPSVQALANELGVSRTTLYHQVLDATGLAPSEHLVRLRVEAAERALREGATVSAAAETAGFASPQHLTRAFKAHHGVTPGAWRDGHR